MVRTAKQIAEIFSAMPENEKVVIFWYDKEESETRLDREITATEWDRIAELTDDEGADEAFAYTLQQFEEERTENA